MYIRRGSRIVLSALLCIVCASIASSLSGCDGKKIDPQLEAAIERAAGMGPALVHPELLSRLDQRSDLVPFPLFSDDNIELRRPVVEFRSAIIRPGPEVDALMGCPEGLWTAADAGGGYLLLTNHYAENKPKWLAPARDVFVRESDMLPVPGGRFTPGGLKDIDQLRGMRTSAEIPVDVEQFKIGRIEVTNSQFAAFLTSLGDENLADKYYDLYHPSAKIVRFGSQYRSLVGCENFPVTAVTWHGADAFCRGQDGKLPSDVQWELAARGFERRLYPWGDAFDPMMANLQGDEDGFAWLAPADSMPKGAGPFGTLNQAGNACEWADNPDRPKLDGPVVNCDLRGGAWDTSDYTARSDAIDNNEFNAANQRNGFRCVW